MYPTVRKADMGVQRFAGRYSTDRRRLKEDFMKDHLTLKKWSLGDQNPAPY